MNKKRKILYFTGTGNCLYVARQLSDADTELLSIPQLEKNGIYEVEADEIGSSVAGLIVKANPADSTLSLVCTPNFPHE